MDINKKDDYGYSALTYACVYGYMEIFEYLINNGADIENEDNYKETPIFASIRNPRIDGNGYKMTQILINSGANINHLNKHGFSPLYVSCFFNKLDIAKLLIDNGADINWKDDEGRNIIKRLYEIGVRHTLISELLRKEGLK